MLGKTAILGSLSVALYNGNQHAPWTTFYLSLAFGILVLASRFVIHRRKYAKLVCFHSRVSYTSRVRHIRFFGVT
jgi:hypothetical protein